MTEHSENKELHWALVHGAKVILSVMLSGILLWLASFASRLDTVESKVEKIEPKIDKQKVMLKNREV